MIDKLDLRAPSFATLRPLVRQYVRVVNHDEYSVRLRPNAYYSNRCDLRPLGIDAMLFLNAKFQSEHNHKLELLDTGKKTYSEFVEIAEAVFDLDPDSLGTMRIDLTADVADVSVSWCKQHTRIRFKRSNDEHGKLEYGQFGKAQVETLRAGKGDSLFRIYNKTEELKMQFRRMCRKQNRDAEPLDFEKEFGYSPDATITRFERQCRGRSIPGVLDTFARLPNAADYNPFDVVEFVQSGNAGLPSIDQCDSPSEYFTGLGLQAKCKEMGMQQFRPWLNKATKGNAARTMQRYGKFFPDGKAPGLTSADLYELYRESIKRQLSA
jgi:hypothetical protein